MEKKFEAVIDLDAQPFTNAVRTAIAGLQALAAELEKANSSLNTMAGGTANSAAAADSVAGSASGAADALNKEASAAQGAAKAHEQHAGAAGRNARATAQAAAENKKMRDSLMIASSMLSASAAVAGVAGQKGLSQTLDMASSIVNIFAMRAMMGAPGMVVATGAAVAKGIGYVASNWEEERTSEREMRSGQRKIEWGASDAQKAIESAKSYSELLRYQKSIENELLAVERERENLFQETGWDQAAGRKIKLLDQQISAYKLLLGLAADNEADVRASDVKGALDSFDKMRQEALSGQGFELDLINATSEIEKIALIEGKIKELRATAEADRSLVSEMGGKLTLEEARAILEEAGEKLSRADSLELQVAGMRDNGTGTGTRKSVPGMAYGQPRVDAFWQQGLFLAGGSGGGQSVDLTRRTATASEKTARNTEALLFRLPVAATWSGA